MTIFDQIVYVLKEISTVFVELSQTIVSLGKWDELNVAIFFTLYFLILLFTLVSWIIERVKVRRILDFLNSEKTLDLNAHITHKRIISENVGELTYSFWAYIVRPTILLLLIFTLTISYINSNWFIVAPICSILLINLNSNSPFLRIMFPFLLLVGFFDLYLRFL